MEFWDTWSRKTAIEKQAIKSVIAARSLIINSVPKNALIAIYIKGSFPRREMKKGSDVDIVPIVTENKYEKNIFGVNCDEIYPCMVVPLSLWEFKHNKLFTKSNTPRAKPDEFLRKLNKYKLIYGKPVNTKLFKIRTDRKMLADKIKTFKKGFMPLYKKGKIKFSTLSKEAFWLVELELNVKGINPQHSFKGIANSIKNKRHIVHDAYRIRQKEEIREKEKAKFILKLQEYLKELSK